MKTILFHLYVNLLIAYDWLEQENAKLDQRIRDLHV